MSRQPGDDPEGLCIAFKSILLSFLNSLAYHFFTVVAEWRMT